jgi:hypothetical protein
MCVADPVLGRTYLGRLTSEHFSSRVHANAHAWLQEHLDSPTEGLSQESPELVRLVTELVAGAGVEPSSRGAMELNLLWLDRAMVESELAEATADGGDPPVELQKRHGELSEQIASFDSER